LRSKLKSYPIDMIISHKAKFIFIHIQRTGGSSIINLLKEHLKVHLDVVSQHGNARSPENFLLKDNSGYFTFSMVRNPWARIFSWYLLINKENLQDLETEKAKFQHFLETDMAFNAGDLHFHYNQVDYLSNEEGSLWTNKIYRFEDYRNSIIDLFQNLNQPFTNIPKLNGSVKIKYQDYYTDTSKKLLSQKCQKDIEYFGYRF